MASLCQTFGMVRQSDWPLAPLSATMDGLDVSDAYWLRVDPVHLEVGMRGLFLRDGLGISPTEGVDLAAVLKPYFAAQGLEFFEPHPERWYLKFPEPADLSTTPLDEVRGRQAMNFLPTGPDAPALMRLVNEAQILLHELPVNQARESAGLAPINSLWPWGGGVAATPENRFDAVHGDDPDLIALARASRIPCMDTPETLRALGDPPRALVMLSPRLDDTSHETDWQAVERGWLLPLLRGLQTGRIRSLDLTVSRGDVLQTHLGALQSWRIWRK